MCATVAPHDDKTCKYQTDRFVHETICEWYPQKSSRHRPFDALHCMWSSRSHETVDGRRGENWRILYYVLQFLLLWKHLAGNQVRRVLTMQVFLFFNNEDLILRVVRNIFIQKVQFTEENIKSIRDICRRNIGI